MNEKQRDRRDFLQNITIVALSLSAVLLFTQTQLFSLASTSFGQYFDQLLETPTQSETADETTVQPLSAPVHIAVTGTYGRYGDTALVSNEDAFQPLGDLLKEALGSARVYTVCSQGEFLEALSSTSVYYDFLSPLPLSVLAGITGAETESDFPARRLILSDRGERGVQLYLQDGSGNCQYCSTAVSRSDLSAAAARYELGNAVFAFELSDTDSAYGAVDPCSLFLTDSAPGLPVLQSLRRPSDTGQLLSALSFNPRTNYRYPESDGTEVIVEGERSLRIRPDGSILYRSGSDTLLSIDAADPAAPTPQEAAAGASAVLQKLLGGDGQLYLLDIRQTGTSTVLEFDYHVGGVPVRFSDGSCAAEVTLRGTAIDTLTLRFRQYTVSGEVSSLLPLRQALAIASEGRSAELTVGYVDNGADTLSACWLAE